MERVCIPGTALSLALLVAELTSCSTSATPGASAPSSERDSVPSLGILGAIGRSLPENTTRISDLVALIDSIYDLSGDTLEDHSVLLSKPDPHGLLMFDHAAAKGFYSFSTFSFLEYRSSDAAAFAFARIDTLAGQSTLRARDNDAERERARMLERTFSKGGSTFLLLSNVIMLHNRRCNYTATDVANEDRLIDTLFAKYPDVRMLQGLCGWGPVKRRP